jgi:FG-GAP-like repeat/Bacterial Ig-like domain (group 3)
MTAQIGSVVYANPASALSRANKRGAIAAGVPLVTLPPAQFAAAVIYTSGGFYGSSIAIGDLDGDGIADVVEANACQASGGNCSNGELSVLLGNSDGTFRAATGYNSGGVAGSSVAIGDVNGDGRPDLIMANECQSSGNCDNGGVSVLLGNGDGTFQQAVSYSAGYVPVAVKIGDLNGDGHPDLIVANQYQCNNCTDGGVSVLFGNGDGTFQAPVSYTSGALAATSVAVDDLNGDGHPDLVVTNEYQCQSCGTGRVSVLLNQGDGTFKAPVTYNAGGYAALSVAVGDVNGDGKPDLIATSLCKHSYNCVNGIVQVLLGNDDGTFRLGASYSSGGYGASSVVTADVNGDSKLDLVVGNTCKSPSNCSIGGVSVLLGNGDGTFQNAVAHSSGGENATSIAIADVNHDGKPDVVTANYCASKTDCTGTVAVLLNTTSDKTTTKVTSSPNPSGITQPVTFTATVTSTLDIPNGQVVSFYLGKTALGTGTTANGIATFTTSFSKANTYYIKASYPGDTYHKASSAIVKQVVSP